MCDACNEQFAVDTWGDGQPVLEIPGRWTIAQIRAVYPNPTTSQDLVPGYSIGGALCYAANVPCLGYPVPEIIMEALQKLNPSLTRAQAERWARDIAVTNDARRFDDAWETARQALTWTNC